MTMPDFPAQYSTAWYAYMQALDTKARAAPTAGYTDEQAQDAAAALFTGGTHTGVSFSYNDAGGAINATVSGGGSARTVMADVSTSNTAAQNSAAIQAALTTAATTGGEVIIPSGSYNFEGVTAPAAGHFTLRGNGRGKTTLVNTHASNASFTMHGTSGSPYCAQWSLSDMRISASAVRTNQYALDVELAHQFAVREVDIFGHGVGIRHKASWDMTYDSSTIDSCGTGVWFPVFSPYTPSAPVSIRGLSCITCTIGCQIDDGVEGLVWASGDFSACGTGVVIDGNEVRGLTFIGTNFERITGDDISVGATTAPTDMNFIGCRFLRSTLVGGSRSVHHIRGVDLNFMGCWWGNYATAIRQESTAWVCSGLSVGSFNVTNLLDANGTLYPVAPIFTSTPFGTSQIGVNNPSTFAKIGVGNSATATTLGTLSRKMEVFNQAGTSIGFVPIYTTIT